MTPADSPWVPEDYQANQANTLERQPASEAGPAIGVFRLSEDRVMVRELDTDRAGAWLSYKPGALSGTRE